MAASARQVGALIEQPGGSSDLRPALQRHCQVLVVGEGLGGTAAALAAATHGMSTILVRFQPWLGGQATSQGVSALDEETPEDGYPHWSASYRAFREGIRRWYLERFEVRDPANTRDWGDGPAFNPGACWVGKLCFEPKVAAEVLEQMLAPHAAEGRLTLIEGYTLAGVLRDGDLVRGVRLAPVEPEQPPLEIRAQVTLEATELGDVLALGRVPYRVGAEGKGETGEPNAHEQGAPGCVQPFTYVFFLERRPEGEDHRIPKPPHYDPNLYAMEMDRRFYVFDDPEGRQTFWDYRRVIQADNFPGSAYPYDIAQINWAPHGNDFNQGCVHDEPQGCNILDREPAAVAAVLQRAREHALGLVYWLQHDVPRDDGHGTGYPNLRLVTEAFPGGRGDGLSLFPYIREARRVIPVTTVREQDLAEEPGLARARFFPDSVGTGWYAMDLHSCPDGEPQVEGRMWNEKTRPFQIPLGLLLPHAVDGLIVAGKALGATHLTAGAYRVHPIEWHVGEAAGTTAALAVAEGVQPRQMRETRRLRRLQHTLLREHGMPLYWWLDLDPKDRPAWLAANLAAAAGVLRGHPESLDFRPDEEVTQEEFAEAGNRLFRAEKEPFDASNRPKDPVPRAEAVTLLVRAEGWEPYRPTAPTFTDVPPQRAVYPWIEAAHANGLLRHVVEHGRLRPDAPLTRRALAFLCYNLLSRWFELG